jgi:phospholipase/carboxylesterase
MVAAACGGNSGASVRPAPEKGRLAARSTVLSGEASSPGVEPLGLDQRRDAFLRIPRDHNPGQALPLVLVLHGAGGSGRRVMRHLESNADRAGFLLLAPDSRDHTWDAVTGEFGPDVTFIDRALSATFSRCAVDARRIAVAGFSDGATYALALARSNGDLFSRGIAFSPGFLIPVTPHKLPRLFVSHGTADQILPIDRCGRPVVAALRQEGYRVRYREFDGGHEVPPAIATDAVRWFLDTAV